MANQKLIEHINKRLVDWKFILKTACRVDNENRIFEAVAVIQELTIIKEIMEDNNNGK